ncbi:hypothetical protein FK531_05390 [Rhodococcus spelaei]|uniref:Lipoprotein n=1 Tax=Rhodococcus spelaei TaxID=2546320 RepID=A0A541BP50_9NOCA|nr:hypothetical protein [Rhodococcus spelaei]TQF74086.1 hypothetical protein FK531_05390 [Rhodococcus spelaei]
MLKRSVIVLAALTLTAFAAGCSDDSSNTDTTTSPSATSSTAPSTTTTTMPMLNPTQHEQAPTVQPGAQAHMPAPTPVVTPAAGPVGADGSTGNNLSPQYCAQNQDPGCPAGSYVGAGAIPNPDGSGNFVPCEGTICTNPDHGAGTDPQQNGGTVMQNPNGDGTVVPCEGTICTNPNNGAGG